MIFHTWYTDQTFAKILGQTLMEHSPLQLKQKSSFAHIVGKHFVYLIQAVEFIKRKIYNNIVLNCKKCRKQLQG